MNQEKALAILKSGRNVLLTGSAGAGKTYVLNQYIQYLKSHKIPVAITASTGIAATHLNGMTIHSWSGIGVKDQLSYADLKHLQERSYLKKSLEHCKVLIIDEINRANISIFRCGMQCRAAVIVDGFAYVCLHLHKSLKAFKPVSFASPAERSPPLPDAQSEYNI